jgi:hypothetical protein
MPITRRSPGIVEFDPNRPPLLEVSMLESLGFYDGDGSVVVAVSSAPHMAGVLSIPASRTQATASPAGPQPGGSRRLPMLPDPDLGDWKPHVIARSKLGPGSVRVTTVAALAVAFLILLALGATVLHRPLGASDELRRAVASQATQLAGALDSLAISLNPSGLDEVGATTSLVNVDQAARALFEAGGRLDPDDPLRAATTALAHRALDLENRLTEALSYRLLLGPLWRFPDLESSTDPTEAAAALSPWQARINAVAGALPRTPDLTGHAEEVAGFVAGFPDWAAPFLDALAERDSQAAGARLADLERTLGRLAVTAEETVGTVIADASHQRAEMSADLHQLVAQATTP